MKVIDKLATVKLGFHMWVKHEIRQNNIRGWFFISCFFTMETSLTYVISRSLWANTFLFNEIM